jgi:hypothetical protein
MRFASLTLFAALAACGGGAVPSNDVAPVENAMVLGNAVEAPASPVPTATAAAGPLLNLAPAALSFVDGASGRAREVPFGTAREPVLTATTAALGNQTGAGRNEECGEGAMDYVRFDGLSLYFQQGKLVGWFLDSAKQGLTTASGVGIGSTRKAVESAYAVSVDETSLGTEFSTESGDFGGILEKGKVTAMWSGQVCQFR